VRKVIEIQSSFRGIAYRRYPAGMIGPLVIVQGYLRGKDPLHVERFYLHQTQIVVVGFVDRHVVAAGREGGGAAAADSDQISGRQVEEIDTEPGGCLERQSHPARTAFGG